MTTHVIQYATTDRQAGDKNQELVEMVFAQLNADDPGGIRYATFRLADGVTFVHIVTHETDDNPLERLPAFAGFQAGLRERVAAPPAFNDATLVGSYRFANHPSPATPGNGT